MCLTELNWFPLGPFRAANKREILVFFESSLAGLSSSWPDALHRQRELTAHLRNIKADNMLSVQLMGALDVLPSIEQTAIAGARAEAKQRCAVAGLAVQRYRLRHGRWPNSLNDIEPDWLGEASDASGQPLIDPFDEKPLFYKIGDTRVVIYSIGEDLQDDGGDFERGQRRWSPDVGFSIKRPTP